MSNGDWPMINFGDWAYGDVEWINKRIHQLNASLKPAQFFQELGFCQTATKDLVPITMLGADLHTVFEAYAIFLDKENWATQFQAQFCVHAYEFSPRSDLGESHSCTFNTNPHTFRRRPEEHVEAMMHVLDLLGLPTLSWDDLWSSTTVTHNPAANTWQVEKKSYSVVIQLDSVIPEFVTITFG